MEKNGQLDSSDCFIPMERVSSTHEMGRGRGESPEMGLDAVKKI
jgi:hypothetical protein